jgi:Leucine-rich repeat (LRR) protein
MYSFVPVPLPSDSFGLAGTIPKELCCMPKLKKLYLYSNRLSGEIPECLYLMGLDVMDLSNNKFSSSSGNTDMSVITSIATTSSVIMSEPQPSP